MTFPLTFICQSAVTSTWRNWDWWGRRIRTSALDGFNKLAGLAFISIVDFVPTFESVANKSLPLLFCFEKTWNEAPVVGNRCLAPDFSLHVWNVLFGLPRDPPGQVTPWRRTSTHILSTPNQLEAVGQSQEHNSEDREGRLLPPRAVETDEPDCHLLPRWQICEGGQIPEGIALNYVSNLMRCKLIVWRIWIYVRI